MREVPEQVGQGRRETRRAVELPGRARWNVSLRADVAVLDISLHGCQISFAAEAMPLGTVVFIRPVDTCTLRGSVRWSNVYGMGLAFDHPLHPAVLEHLVTISEWTYLQQRATRIVPKMRFAVGRSSEQQ